MYDRRVQQLSVDSKPIHRTRLKEMLMKKVPDLQAYTKGRDVLLVFEKDVGPAIALACSYDDTMHMAKSAKLMRTQMKEHETKFSGSFSADNIQSSVPKALLELVCMIEHGPDIQSQLDNKMTKSDLAIAQLLMYNYHSKQSKQPRQQRHAQEREPPLCIYFDLCKDSETSIDRYLIPIRFIHLLSPGFRNINTTRRSCGRTLFV